MYNKLKEKDVKPIAIISLSIPNGLLRPHYDDKIVSGKQHGRSLRYNYEDGKFKLLDGDKSRVVFIYHDTKYESRLKKYFPKMTYCEKEVSH